MALDYAKWDALDSSDEEPRKTKPQVVRKQAVKTSAAQELVATAEEARRAEAEGDRLQARMDELLLEQKRLADAGNTVLDSGAAGPTGTAGFEEPPCRPLPPSRLDMGEFSDGTGPVGERGGGWALACNSRTREEALSACPMKRRSMDHVWAVEGERAFEARTSAPRDRDATESTLFENATEHAARWDLEETRVPTMLSACGVDGEQRTAKAKNGVAVAAAGKTVGATGACGSVAVTAVGSVGARSSTGNSGRISTLRRLKHLDAAVAGAIERECGVNLRAVDGFRLTMDGPVGGRLLPGNQGDAGQTRVLIIAAGNSFLCEEPICEEESMALSAEEPGEGVPCGCAAATVSEPQGGSSEMREDSVLDPGAAYSAVTLGAATETVNSKGAEGGSVEVELCFFRASPNRDGLAKRLGTVPVLHLTLETSDGLCESLEFVGVHQRQYCVEEPPSDAIARNLTESLLKVALEFVFHPSRTKYAKELLVLRECSACAEARERRESLLPTMVDQAKMANDRIQRVRLEFCSPRTAPSAAASASKGRSFLVLDEDVLKVAPAGSPKSTAGHLTSKGSTFRGLGQGFLNSSRARRRGLGPPRQEEGTATASSSSSSAKPSLPEPLEEPPGGTAASPTSSTAGGCGAFAQQELGGARFDRDDKQMLLLPAADVGTRLTEDPTIAQAVERGFGFARVSSSLASSPTTDAASKAPPPDEDEDEPGGDQLGQPNSISELASLLFGDGAAEEDRLSEEQTESTKTPSPKASCCGGGAPSERSEPVTEDGADNAPPVEAEAAATGIRLLQQRRRMNNMHSPKNNAASSKAAEAGAPCGGAGGGPESEDDLVRLWMSQRW